MASQDQKQTANQEQASNSQFTILSLIAVCPLFLFKTNEIASEVNYPSTTFFGAHGDPHPYSEGNYI